MDKRKKSVALNSVFASLLLTLLKLIVGIITGSIGIISEAAHSALDFGAAFITYLAVRISGRPVDISHHFGYGKVESVSALIETGLLLFTGIWIIYEAVTRLIYKTVEIEVAWYSFVVMVFSMIIDISRSRILRKVAEETKSQALEADALHFRSDIYSSFVVVLGLIFVMIGIEGADSIAAIGVAIFIILASYKLGKRTIDALIDAVPGELTEQIINAANKVSNVVGIERLRVRPVGPIVYIDMIVTISRKTPLELAHKVTNEIEENIKKVIDSVDLVIHVKPIAGKGETLVERIQTLARNQGIYVHDIFTYSIKNKKFINFDLDVESSDTLENAHAKATKLEDSIHAELGDEININTHIEPVETPKKLGIKINKKQIDEVNKVAKGLKKIIPEILNVHNILIHKKGDKLFISLHCNFEKKIKINNVHDLSTKIENIFKKKIPKIEKITVHTEPL